MGLAFESDVEVISVQSLVSHMLSNIVPYARTWILSSDVVFTVKLAASRSFASAMNGTVLHLVHCATLSSPSSFTTLHLQLMHDLNELMQLHLLISYHASWKFEKIQEVFHNCMNPLYCSVVERTSGTMDMSMFQRSSGGSTPAKLELTPYR